MLACASQKTKEKNTENFPGSPKYDAKHWAKMCDFCLFRIMSQLKNHNQMKIFALGRRGRKKCRCMKPQCKNSYQMDKINTNYSSTIRIEYFFNISS